MIQSSGWLVLVIQLLNSSFVEVKTHIRFPPLFTACLLPTHHLSRAQIASKPIVHQPPYCFAVGRYALPPLLSSQWSLAHPFVSLWAWLVASDVFFSPIAARGGRGVRFRVLVCHMSLARARHASNQRQTFPLAVGVASPLQCFNSPRLGSAYP